MLDNAGNEHETKTVRNPEGSNDRCKNESDKYESETFIIDRTAPKISVDFGDTASNGKYE